MLMPEAKKEIDRQELKARIEIEKIILKQKKEKQNEPARHNEIEKHDRCRG